METRESDYYMYGIIKNIAFLILFWVIYFYFLFKQNPNMEDWSLLILLDHLGIPTLLISMGYMFLYLLRASGCLFAIIGPSLVLLIFAFVVDSVIEKLGLPKNSWPYAFSILGILLLVINIIKLISNIKWYRIFKSNESTETESL